MKDALRIENLSKRYRLGASGETAFQYRTLRESLYEAVRGARCAVRGKGGEIAPSPRPPVPPSELWALKEINLRVQPGEVVGIIGRNGAGKSTLLKILSRITAPTTGRIEVNGCLGCLLEAGTGFHPELSGRENIFLSGAILGMTRAEIRAKLEGIVAFAEVERFLDTPVKRYSTGMYLRLAFAVAAHLEPEILLVDEVLAVGDARFQKKCLGKMGEVAAHGRTVLFVSHQLSAVKALCTRVIQIHGGSVARDGEPRSVVDGYLSEGGGDQGSVKVWDDPESRPGNAEFRLVALRVLDADGEGGQTFSSSRPILIEMEFDLGSVHSALCVGFDLLGRDGTILFRSMQNDRGEREWPRLAVGRNRLRCVIPSGLLNAGAYYVAPKVGLHAIAWIVNGDAEVGFQVEMDHSESPFWSIASPEKFPGVIAPCLEWRSP